MSYKIVIDSCGELPESWKTDENIESIPLTLTVEGEDIIDDETFDQSAFFEKDRTESGVSEIFLPFSGAVYAGL